MNNYSAIGFMIMAAKELDVPRASVEALEQMMVKAMDEKTEQEAEKAYKSF
jgi:hypothetical protein